jgi:outer membrane protein OmpA-like peptidoglycan-associated protein
MKLNHIFAAIALCGLAAACSSNSQEEAYTDHNNNAGQQYAPQMYDAKSYEPYSQVETNNINANGQNMRRPADGTIMRAEGFDDGNIPIELTPYYPLRKDSDMVLAETTLKNPILNDAASMERGKYMYTVYCAPCHSAIGNGQGSVGLVYGGVANFNAQNLKNVSSGHVYHAITAGANRMNGYATQILPKDRWHIVNYVNKLRGYTDPDMALLGAATTAAPANAADVAAQTQIIETDTKVIIRFPSGSANNLPNPKLDDYLKKTAEKMTKEGKKIAISGHTDNTGKPAANSKLSLDRAELIKNKLIKFGAKATTITTKGAGSTQPIGDNNTPKGKQENRRVELNFN